jgi:mono/diheme cytochrome c family protein
MAVLVAVLLTCAVIGFYLTAPSTLPSNFFAARPANLANGETMFNVGGCTSCHGKKQDSGTSLGGGLVLHSPFGSFRAPNISSSVDHGIGAWSEAQFATAMLRGVGRSGEHLYPSYPYTSYRRMSVVDVRDLYAFLKTLPPDPTPSEPHDLQFPFNIRRAIGVWKLLFFDEEPFAPDPSKGATYDRGAYLVEGPGHCAECHSPRNLLGAIKNSERFAGGAVLGGDGWVPNITPHPDGLESWSLRDMEFFLEVGVGPDGSSVSGEMEKVIRNLAKLTVEDRHAMAIYLRALPPRSGKKPAKSPTG